MKKLQPKNKDIFILIAWLIPTLGSLILYNENPARSLVVFAALVIWYIGYYNSKNQDIFPSLFLIFISIFNITISLGDLDGCYKNSVFVNYLCPSIHVIDLFALLAIIVRVVNIKLESIPKYIFTLLPLTIFQILNILIHPNINSIVEVLRIYILLTFALLHIDVFNEHFTKLRNISKTIFPVILISLSVQLILSFLQYYLGRDLNLQLIGESSLLAGSINSSFISTQTGEVLRGYGTFPHPNVLAGFSIASTILVLKYIASYKQQILLLSISFVIVLLTFSRIHLLLLISILLLYVIYRYTLKQKGIVDVNADDISGIDINKRGMYTSLPFFPILKERILSLNVGSLSVTERITLFNESLRILKENWVLGVGNGEFVRYLNNEVRTSSQISLFQPVHNIFMLLFTQQGIFGSILFLSYLVYILIKRNTPKILLILSIVSILTIGMFDHYLISIPQGIVIFLMFILF